MTEDEVRGLLRRHLGSHINKKGWVLYTGLDALAVEGDFYLMGYNPGSGDDVNKPLEDAEIFESHWSAYTHQCWQKHCSPCLHIGQEGDVSPEYLVRHQQHVKDLFRLIRRCPTSVFSANAIFAESCTADDLQDAVSLWECCWPIHQAFLAKVRPRWIICLGNGAHRSSFQLLAKKANKQWQYCCKDRTPATRYLDGKWFSGSLQLSAAEFHQVSVLGVPHPSWFPISESLKSFIQRKVLADLSV